MAAQQAVALSHCHKATQLGNIIAIHMLEYINAAAGNTHGLYELAHEFLDVCRIMWSIETGLIEYTRSSQSLPTEMTQELDRKFNKAHGDFQALDHWLNRSLNKQAGKGNRLTRGWQRMFQGNDISKIREALGKTREALNMSALVFQWSVGEDKIDESLGIGYTALFAALQKLEGHASSKASLSHGSPAPAPSIRNQSIEKNHVSHVIEETTMYSADTLAPPRTNTIRSSTSGSAVPYPPRMDSVPRLPDLPAEPNWPGMGQFDLPDPPRRHHTLSNHTDSVSTRSAHSRNTPPSDPPEDLRSSGLAEIETLSVSENDNIRTVRPTKVVRVTANPSKMPRWTPQSSEEANNRSLKPHLIAAIRERNINAIKRSLNNGVSCSAGPDFHPLNEAIHQHDHEIVRLILGFGADPNVASPQAVSPLLAAIEEGFLDAAATLLKYGANPNLPPASYRDSPFTVATLKQDEQFIRLFLIYGADVNQMTMDGETILTKMITQKASSSLIGMVLDYGAEVNGKTKKGETPLYEAVSADRVDIVTALLDHGANPNLPGPKHMLWPAIHSPRCMQVLLERGADHKKAPGVMEQATATNKIDSVKVLLKAGVDPNSKKDGIFTPLCTSIRDNRHDIFNLLLSHKADPNVPASEYPCFKCVTHNRLHFLPPLVAAGGNLHNPKGIAETAVQHLNMEALTWLLDNGVSPNDKEPDTKATPLTTAISQNRPDFVELLLARGANPNIRGQDWPVCMAVRYPDILRRLLPSLAQPRAFKGVIEMAVSANNLESVKLLLAAGVSVEDRNGGVFSPLTTAIRERHKDIVQYLLDEAGADPNSPGEHLPIVKALRRYEPPDTEIIEMLLRKGADPNKVYRGHSAIIQAIEMGDALVLRLLIEKWGVDLEAKDDTGRTPIEIAELRGWDEGKEILVKGKKAV